jgi:transcriptional regulator with XRE-family HTH domain
VTVMAECVILVMHVINSVTGLQMNAAQCRMARAALRLPVRELADAAGVSPTTVSKLERDEDDLHPRTIAAIRAALEAAGVEFIEQNGGGPGVRLRGTSGK